MDKKPTKRVVALPRLYKSIETFMDTHGLTDVSTVGERLKGIQAEWFKEAQK